MKNSDVPLEIASLQRNAAEDSIPVVRLQRNQPMKFFRLAVGSHRKIWWYCEQYHVWQAPVYSVTGGGGCPYCSGLRPVPGETDLPATHPALAAEWDTVRNESLTPQMVSAGSHKNVWWICKNGHSYRSKVYSRSSGVGCPYCAGKRVIPGQTDLATTHPALAAEWDFSRNGALTPQAVSKGCAKQIWWICQRGHSYHAKPYSRVAGAGCPYCAGKLVIPGQTDLATTHPQLAAQWDQTQNGAFTPQMVSAGSHKKVWWLCPLGHSYASAPYSRAAGSGCPYCTNRKVLQGFNDLETMYPELSAQWYSPLNDPLTPSMVTRGSTRKVWWKCAFGHVWQAAVFSRTRPKPSGCPVCMGNTKKRHRKKDAAAWFATVPCVNTFQRVSGV